MEQEKTVASREYLDGAMPFAGFISDQFRRFGSSISLRHKKLTKRRGPLFEGVIKRASITNDTRMVEILCYIHHNCIHHHLSQDYDGWQFSSYLSYFSSKETLISRTMMIDWLGGINHFRRVHEEFKKSNIIGGRDTIDGI